jgi:hypothetical protein
LAVAAVTLGAVLFLLSDVGPVAAAGGLHGHRVWTNASVRHCPWFTCRVVASIGPGRYQFSCQRKAAKVRVTIDGSTYVNRWWANIFLIDGPPGWVSAVYLSGGANYQRVPGIPVC